MISDLVASLPEVYQPIYGHPELSGQISRPCDDRLEKIEGACAALQAYLGRPLKVLDLGCAQGFFSLNLAEKGATVHGVDFLDKNIAVCNALAKEHPDLNASFETGRVEVAIQNLSAGEYDLVLGLSVFHHIVHENGIDAVRQLLDRIAKNCKALIVELALREEPLYWGSSQPEDPRTLLETIAYVHELARHGTHLAPIPRPLYFASNRYFLLNNRVEQFESWSAEPHALARGTHEGSRRYFFSAHNVLKLYRFDLPRGEHNKAEFELEKRFFNNPPSELFVPACREIGENDAEGWLLTERFPGRLLLDLLREGEKLDSRAVLLAVLDQLRKLEAAGLYHNDVRTWNVLVSEDGTPYLIDYGSISPKAEDCVWPRNPFLAFFIFVREVATGVVEDPDPLRTISISPYSLPQPYSAWAASFWSRPLGEWSFELMFETLRRLPVEAELDLPLEPIAAWMKSVEEAIQIQKNFAFQLRRSADSDRKENQQMLSAVTDKTTQEIGALAESFTQFGNALLGKISQAESLQKQLAGANERILDLERRCAVAESKRLLSDQRATASEQRALGLEQRVIFVEQCAAKHELRADAAVALTEEQSLRASAAELRADAAEARAEEQLTRADAAEARAGELLTRVDAAEVRADAAEVRAGEQLLRANAAEARAEAAEASQQAQRIRMDELGGSAHHWWQQANSWHEQVLALHRSTSWQITKPMRAVKRLANGDFSLFQRAGAIATLQSKKTFRPMIALGIQEVFKRPELRARLSSYLKRYPSIHQRLLRVAVNTGKVHGSLPVVEVEPTLFHENPLSEEMLTLTPHARQIYAALKAAIEKNQRHD